MSKQFNFLKSAVMAAVFAFSGLVSGSAQAAIQTLTYAGSLVPTDTDFDGQPIQIAQFNPAWGTLQSVTVTATGTGAFHQYYENTSTRSGGSVSISQTLDMILHLPSSGSPLVNLSQTESHVYAPGTFDRSLDFAGTSGGSAFYNVTATTAETFTDGGTLAQFTGSGLVNLLASAAASAQVSNINGNLVIGWSTLAGLDLSVIYSYIAIPEPASWVAGTAAMAGFGFLLTRKKSQVNAGQKR